MATLIDSLPMKLSSQSTMVGLTARHTGRGLKSFVDCRLLFQGIAPRGQQKVVCFAEFDRARLLIRKINLF